MGSGTPPCLIEGIISVYWLPLSWGKVIAVCLDQADQCGYAGDNTLDKVCRGLGRIRYAMDGGGGCNLGAGLF